MIDIKLILDLCHLKGVKKVDDGWRATTIYDTPPDPGLSLWISSTGGFKCHRSQKTGHIVQLYADSIGKPFTIARANLRKQNIVPRDFEIIQDEPDPDIEKKKVRSSTILGELKTEIDWDPVCRWRGLPKETFEDAARFGSFGYITAYTSMGSVYAFVATNPPIEGIQNETKGIMVRSTIPENKGWKTALNYPIWCSTWNKEATEILLVEGQWDALALHTAINCFNGERLQNIQVLALCGAKNIEKYPEIMAYLTGKTIIQIPDQDEKAGEEILIKTYEALEKIECTHKLLRIPKGEGKDFNDWWKKGITKERFSEWLEGVDIFRVSGGIVIDSEFRLKHKLKINSLVEINPDGEPVEIYERYLKTEEYMNGKKLFDVIKPFPMLSNYVGECAGVSEAPLMWHVMSFLTYFSAILGRRFKFSSGSSGSLYPMIYTLLVGPSSMGKSECMNMLRSIVGKVYNDMFCSESFSAESLFDEFALNPQKMMVINEFSEWLGAGEGSYRHSAMKGFIKMYDAHMYSEDNPFKMNFRTKGKSVVINEPALAVLAACTPEQIMTNGDNLRGGIVGRFSYVIGKNRYRDVLIPERISMSLRNDIEKFFRSVLTTPVRNDSAMKFSPSALALYGAAFTKQREREKRITNSDDMQTYLGRWRVRTLKNSMNLELLLPRHIWPMERSDVIVGEEALTTAIKIGNVLERSFYELFELQFKSDNTSRSARLQNRVINFMLQHSGNGHQVSKTDMLHYMNEDSGELERTTKTLIEAGKLFEKQIKIPGRRGPPKTIYLLAKPKESYANEFPE